MIGKYSFLSMFNLHYYNYYWLVMQPQEKKKGLKALLCQLSPKFKKKTENIERAKLSLKHYSSKDQLDVILFPEMSFTGYNFESQEDAMPLACKQAEGEEFLFASNQAKRLRCYILYGYIEKAEKDGQEVLYNSVGVIGRNGEWIMNVRKTHLFFNDKLWCVEGDGFRCLEITNCKGDKFKCLVGICMDINPKDFTSGEWEWADFGAKQGVDVLLFLTNWVDSSADSVEDKDVLAMYNYWLHRLTPLISAKNEPPKKPIMFLAADRVGTEYSYFDKKNTHFFGSSCAIMLNPPYIVQKLDKKSEGYLLVEGSLPK